MAIYHLQSGFVSRSTGRSSVQSASYITGEQLHESRRDLNVNYKNRHSDIAFTDTLAPEYAPESFKNIGVWDLLENFEDEYAVKRFPNNLESRDKYLNSAQTAQTIVVALPRELEVGVVKELIEEFALSRFISRGLIVTYAIHDDEGNPHAHLQISRRAVNLDGTLAWAKDRDVVSRKELLVTRKLWADLTNNYLEREGFTARITEKSFADLGIELGPTRHRGWISDKLKSMGVTSRIVTENAEVFARNREILIEHPNEILPELTSKAATFTQVNLLKAIQKRVGDDAKLVASIFEGALQQSVVVGEGIDGQLRYTTEGYKAVEAQAIDKTTELLSTPFAQSLLNKDSIEAYLTTNFAQLSSEQRDAVLGMTQANSLSVLIGRAGAGKTTTLRAVSEVYQNAGYRVIGTSLSAMAASNLESEAGIKSTTIHSWLYKWDRYQAASEKFLSFDNVMEEGLFKQLDWYQDLKKFELAKLTKDSVLIVDEAGMVGTRQWGELLAHVQRAGAKLIAVGDDNQFKAIEAGDFFREIKQQAEQAQQLYQLQTIRRQRQDWMKAVSHQLAELNIFEGLSVYEQRGHVHQATKEDLSKEIAAIYLEKLIHSTQEGKSGEGLVLAFTNKQTQEINIAIREKLKQVGMIGKQDVAMVNDKSFALGDRIVFLENDKNRLQIYDQDGLLQEKQFIKNGTQGQIESVNERGDIKISLKEGLFTTIRCEVKEVTPKVALGQAKSNPITQTKYLYTKIDHGYAVTTHKAQGQTLDFAIVAASKYMDAKGLYVAMTRHRNDVQLFYAKEDFLTFKALSSHLSRFEHKDLVKDYTIRPENEAAWQKVQEYRLAVLDAAAIIKEGSGSNEIDWYAYHQIKLDQVRLGKEILNNFKAHELYINQAGFTVEMLEISTGIKARPLSIAEEKAKITVELYGETAQMARGLWREIRKTHPGTKCYSHPKYEQFNEIRYERNSLAQTISENYPLHREFINQFSHVYGINSKTVEAQSRQFREWQSTDKYSEKTDKLWYNVGSHNLSHGKYETSKNHNTDKESQLNSEFKAKDIQFNHYQNSVDTKFIKQGLDSRIKDLAYQFLGQPNQQKATEWRYGNKGSISIHVAGHKQGLYSNFETGESGNALKFIADQLNCDHKQAFKWGAEWLGHDRNLMSTKPVAVKDQLLPQAKQEWITIYPAPNHKVEITAEKQLAYMLKGRHETARYAYKDADNNILGYVVRLEDKQGNKITPTLTYCRNQTSKEQWRWQGFGNDRPLYGLDQLKAKPDAKVLIVEGEKTCEAARVIFPGYAVITWSGGCGAVNKTDWTVLKDKDITIWPDNDKPGLNAAIKIADILRQVNQQAEIAEKTEEVTIRTINRVKIVDLPHTLTHKWDLADKIPDGVNIQEMLVNAFNHDRTAIKTVEIASEDVKTDQIRQAINIEDIYKHCKNHYMGYCITHENTDFIIKITNATYQELKQWRSLSGFSIDDSKLEMQAALTAVYTYLSKNQLDKDPYNVHSNTLEKALCIGAIAGKQRIENPSSLTADEEVVHSAARQYDVYEKEIAELATKSPTSGLTSVAKIEVLRATFRCLSMTGFHVSKEMSAKILDQAKASCGMEIDGQKAKAAIGIICAQLAKEAPPTIDQPLTIQQQKEKSIVNYVNARIASQDYPWGVNLVMDTLKTQLERDPMLALETWKTFANDNNSFIPLSFAEMKIKTQEANALLASQKANITTEMHDRLKATINTNPQEVIQYCHGVIECQLDKVRQTDVNKYTELAKEFLKLSYNDRENSPVARELNDISNRYQNDEKFSKSIESNPETERVQRQLIAPKINEVHRGFER